jgi:hypothetical protein
MKKDHGVFFISDFLRMVGKTQHTKLKVQQHEFRQQIGPEILLK